MKFSTALKNESRKTYTENGATAYNTTGDALLDFFGSAGSLRSADESRITRLFADAYKENPLLATKALFYVRDVREGLGERRTFRVLLNYLANMHPEALRNNIKYIGEYGRYDDLYSFVGTKLESAMWKYVRQQLMEDESNMRAGKSVSLLAKWLKTPDSSSHETRRLGALTAYKLKVSIPTYKKRLRKLRRYIDVTEVRMSANEWRGIKYENVPSRAMKLYKNAFNKHDGTRFSRYLNAVESGTSKINSSTLYPYDILEEYFKDSYWHLAVRDTDRVLEAQWKALPNYLSEPANAIVVADTSGSMYGRPLASAVGLAIYFAERNTGAYHNMWMNFSGNPTVQRLRGETLHDKLVGIDYSNWGNSTNLEAVFDLILNIAKRNHVSSDEMVKSIIVISDMEINHCSGSWSFYDEMRKRYKNAGYNIPNVVFWNVDSRNDVFHADKNRKGVQLCSGQSASTFKALMASIGMTPIEMMVKVLNSERYKNITM